MIGVIGGNGVAATAKLMQLVEERCTRNGATRDAHHPEIIVWQATQVPSRSMFLEGRGASFIPGYVDIGRKLESCGCDRLCMCCNTAHYALETLETEIGLPFINLISEVAQKVDATGFKKAGMMCSDGLRKIHLYDHEIQKINPDIELVYPDELNQKIVTKGICNAKKAIRFDIRAEDNPTKLFQCVCKHLLESGADVLVAGCTDIRNVFFPTDIPYIDSLEVLADAIWRYH